MITQVASPGEWMEGVVLKDLAMLELDMYHEALVDTLEELEASDLVAVQPSKREDRPRVCTLWRVRRLVIASGAMTTVSAVANVVHPGLTSRPDDRSRSPPSTRSSSIVEENLLHDNSAPASALSLPATKYGRCSSCTYPMSVKPPMRPPRGSGLPYLVCGNYKPKGAGTCQGDVRAMDIEQRDEYMKKHPSLMTRRRQEF